MGACLSKPPLCCSQGLSDFCSSPDSYILNLTQEETGLGSGDHTSGCTPCILRPLRLRWGGGASPAQFCPAEALSTCPSELEKREGIKTLRQGIRERGGLGHLEKVGSPVGSGQVQKQPCGVFRSARSGCGCSRRESAGAEGVGARRAGGLGGRGQPDHRRALRGEGGKCGPAPPPVRGEAPGAYGLPRLRSRCRHPELLFPLQPGRLQPLSTG